MTNPLVGHVLGSHGHMLLSHVLAQGLVGHMMSHVLGHVMSHVLGHMMSHMLGHMVGISWAV